jgi:hypothetical protein
LATARSRSATTGALVRGLARTQVHQEQEQNREQRNDARAGSERCRVVVPVRREPVHCDVRVLGDTEGRGLG